ncbi:hypothetical protein OHA98_04680 [Streptomyces sp. NBC_00654]|uniref:effector-associated constant component EACC1 n=1 Tax=Streptomyces sp. NBC_00654 TaxID=2975799 RepID=UPI002250959A|nr:hypothetical protein [Streptomyces sp. NBC_00654]MCX4964122.1 hypothetical protein [Streptomyces sp. NBC_00654]
MARFEIGISDSDNDTEELRELYRLFRDDDRLSAESMQLESHAPVPGRLGLAETVIMSLSGAGSVAAFSRCLLAWINTRKPGRLEITLFEEKHTLVTDGKISEKTMEKLIEIISSGSHEPS